MNYVISITGPEALGVLEDICEELALPLNVTLHGRGTAVQSMLDLLGIESNVKRVVLSTATEEKTAALIEAQKRRLHIGVPGHGIVIAVPVKSIGGGKTVAYLMGEENKSAKTAPPSGYAYELIVVVASEGQTDLVMNAARAAGARGGTVLHGKGTGRPKVPQHLHCRGKRGHPHRFQDRGEKRDHALHSQEGRAGHPGKGHRVLAPHERGSGFRIL